MARGFKAFVLVLVVGCGDGPVVPADIVGTITGRVVIEGDGVDGVAVAMGDGSAAVTAGGGLFNFGEVPAGVHTVTISGYPEDATFTATSAAVEIATAGEVVEAVFEGVYIRTAGVIGSVTVEGKGLARARVTLAGHGAELQAETGAAGAFEFRDLRRGEYVVTITNYDGDAIRFDTTRADVTLAVGELLAMSFDGVYRRTAAIAGAVTADGEGLAGVTVTLKGGPERVGVETVTDASGEYAFAGLRAGSYIVEISGYDADSYTFTAPVHTVSVALGEVAVVSFEATLLRTAGISGGVYVDGVGIDSAKVTLAWAKADTIAVQWTERGQFSFTALAEGVYEVSVTNPEPDVYDFDVVLTTVVVKRHEAKIVTFTATYARSAGIRGRLFLDGDLDDVFNERTEEPYEYGGFPVTLRGPMVNTVQIVPADSTGAYAVDDLLPGTYQVSVAVPDSIAEDLEAEGLEYRGGQGSRVEILPGRVATVNVPIDIVAQTARFTVCMGYDDVAGPCVRGVRVDLYADLDLEQHLASDTTNSAGLVSLRFDREDDTDGVVFATIVADSLPAEGLVLTGSEIIELAYGRFRVAEATRPFRLANLVIDLMARVASYGNALRASEPLNGWAVEYLAGNDTVPIQVDTSYVHEELLAGIVGPVRLVADVDSLPVTYTVRVVAEQGDGQDFMDSPLVWTHTGLELYTEPTVAGTMEVRYTTQDLVVGFHWERDQEVGLTSTILGGDRHPTGSREALEATLLVEDGSRTRKAKDVDVGLDCDSEEDEAHDFCVYGNPRTPADDTLWVNNVRRPTGTRHLVRFRHLPADINFSVEGDVGRGRVMVGETEHPAFKNFGPEDLGAFGELSGTNPRVWLCPLATGPRPADCSTFAYTWAQHEVSGTVMTTGGAEAVKLEDIAVELEGISNINPRSLKAETNEDGEFRFRKVQGGEYKVGTAPMEDWSPGKSTTFVLLQDVDFPRVCFPSRGLPYGCHKRSPGETRDPVSAGRVHSRPYQLAYQNTTITGTVANDDNAPNADRVSSSEAIAGIRLELRTGRSTGSEWLMGDSVAVTETDSRGRYSFKRVQEGGYVVVAVSDEHYVAARNVQDTTKAFGVNVSGLVQTTFADPIADGGDALPNWDYEEGGIVGDTENPDTDFIILFGDGTLSGRVMQDDDLETVEDGGLDADSLPDPAVGIEVRLRRCHAAMEFEDSDYAKCYRYDSSDSGDLTLWTDADGEWSATELLEGKWVIRVKRPRGWTPSTREENEGLEREAVRLDGPGVVEVAPTVQLAPPGP